MIVCMHVCMYAVQLSFHSRWVYLVLLLLKLDVYVETVSLHELAACSNPSIHIAAS